MFDIKSLAIQESTVLHLLHPADDTPLYADGDAEKEPITITVASSASKQYRTAVNAMHNRTQKRTQVKGKKPLTLDEQREEGVELLAACCISSENLIYEGKPVQSKAEFRRLLSDDSFQWLNRQVDEALGDIGNFIAQSLKD